MPLSARTRATSALVAILAPALAILCAPPHDAAGQVLEALTGAVEAESGEPGAPSAEPAPAEPTPEDPARPPDRAELAPRLVELVDLAGEARRRLEVLGDPSALVADAGRSAVHVERLAERFAAATAGSAPSSDELADLRESAVRLRSEVTSQIGRASERLAEVDQIERAWRDRRTTWSAWGDELAARGEMGPFGDDFARARRRIEEVITASEAAAEPLLDLQRQTQELERRSRELEGQISGEVETQRAGLRDRSPALLSPAHRRELAERSPLAGGAAFERLLSVEPGFLAAWGWVLALQLLVVVAVAAIARRFRGLAGGDPRWKVLLSHPWAMGVFVAATTLSPIYELPPPGWRLAVLTVVAASASILARGMFRNPRKRHVIYALAFVYVGLTAVRALALPEPWLRLVLAGVALVAAPWLLLLARRNRRSDEGGRAFTLSLQVAAAAIGLVFLGEVVGYHRLARWLLESVLASAFVGFVAVFLIRLGRGSIHLAVRRPSTGRLAFLRRVGFHLGNRLGWLLEVVLVGAAILYVLALWGAYPSPLEAWRDLSARGFEVAGFEVTVLRVLLALGAIYVALLVSEVLRALFDERLEGRDDLDRGVSDSVKTLLHYSLIVVGFTVALAVVGFDLSTFALVAGALGVGIGFGLQNIVGNFVAGLILLFERPVRVGDTVVVDGQWGVIRKIGLRSTVVNTFDHSEIIVPNSDLVSEKVTNWTLSNDMARILIPVGVAYGSDLEAVFRILTEAAASHPLIVENPAPLVHFVDFGESSLDFEVRIWVQELPQRLSVRSDFLREVDRRFREAAIEIPFPQRDVHLRGGAAVAGAAAGAGVVPAVPDSADGRASVPPAPATAEDS